MSTVALVLSASNVLGADWQAPVAVTNNGRAFAWANTLTTTGTGTVLAAYDSDPDNDGHYGVFVRRSNNAGLSWGQPKAVSNSCAGGGPSVAASGQSVDVVWIDTPTCSSADLRRIKYRRSTDGGKTWNKIKTIADASPHSFPAVAQGPDGTVVVGWTDDSASTIYARTSTDKGKTFGSTTKIAKTTNESFEALPGVHDGGVQVAAGDGVLYLGYYSDQDTLHVRTSTNRGASWSAAVALTNSTDGYSEWTLSAEGTHAVAAFAELGTSAWTRYRLTTDRGANWSAAVNLTSASGPDSAYPHVALVNGRLHAAFRQLGTNGWWTVFYREGPESGPLSTPVKVASSNDGDVYDAGVTVTGDKTVVGFDSPVPGADYDLYTRNK